MTDWMMQLKIYQHKWGRINMYDPWPEQAKKVAINTLTSGITAIDNIKRSSNDDKH